MDLITIYLHNEDSSLRRERLYRDRLNPSVAYDYLEIRRLFRFQRENVYNIVDQLKDVLDHCTGRGHCLTPLMQVCIGLRYYTTGCMQLSLGAWMKVDLPRYF
jgi:hypothetical protein